MACCGLQSKDELGTLTGSITKLDGSMVNKHIIHVFEERLKKGKIDNKKTAVHFGDNNVLSYAQLNAFASCLARNIIDRLGYDYTLNGDNDLVLAVCLPMSEKTIALILAILKTGAAYLPLDPEHPEELLLKILSTFKPQLLITDDNGKIFNKYDFEEFHKICKITSIEELWIDIEFTQEPKTKRASMEVAWDIEFLEDSAKSGQHPVVIMYCQGMECEIPVGVRVGNKSILNLVNFNWRKFKMSDKDACCMTVSISSPISIPQLFIPLLLGCTLHLFRRMEVNDMDSFLKNVSWRKITRLSFPTHHLKPLLDAIEFQSKEVAVKSLKALRVVVCRGSMIPPNLVQRFFTVFKSGVRLSNCFGFIQTTGEITFEIFDSLKDYESKLVLGRSTFGIIVDNVRIYIVDENMNIAPNGFAGEICVSGDCLALGYVGEGPKRGPTERIQFLKNPFHDHIPLFEKMYRTGESGSTIEGKRRLFLDDRHDLLAEKHDDDSDIHIQRKW